MAQIILTGHGDFATGLFSALSMVAGDIPQFSTVTFKADEASSFQDRLTHEIQGGLDKCGSVLVFCDLKGGTPFNCSMMSAAESPDVEIIAGANLPLMIETIFAHNQNLEASASELAAIALEAGKASIFRENQETFLGQQGASSNTCEEDEDGI